MEHGDVQHLFMLEGGDMLAYVQCSAHSPLISLFGVWFGFADVQTDH
jgi:hypothetical protein